jgi:hypothetical protein
VDPVGSGYGPVAGSCEYGDEPSGSGATDLIYTQNSGRCTFLKEEITVSTRAVRKQLL